METCSALLAFCARNSPVTGEFHSQRPATWSWFDASFDLYLNKQSRKQSRRRWFDMPTRSLWRHCNYYGMPGEAYTYTRLWNEWSLVYCSLIECRLFWCQVINWTKADVLLFRHQKHTLWIFCLNYKFSRKFAISKEMSSKRWPFCSSINMCLVSVLQITLQWRHNDRDGVSNHQLHHCFFNRLFRRRSEKTSKLSVAGLCAGNSPVTDEFPAQRASNAENVSIWWRHHAESNSEPNNWCKWHFEMYIWICCQPIS